MDSKKDKVITHAKTYLSTELTINDIYYINVIMQSFDFWCTCFSLNQCRIKEYISDKIDKIAVNLESRK